MTKFNILYFAFVSDHFGGVEQKIIGQFDALNNINNNTHLYFVSSSVPNEKLKSEIKARDKVHSLVNTMVNNAFFRRKEKFEFITNELKKFSPLDTVIYFRYPNADLLFLDFLKKNSDYKFVTEHQEIESAFLIGVFNGNYLRNLLELIYGKAVRSNLAGFVGVTDQIADFQNQLVRKRNKKYITIGNPIDIESYPLRNPINSLNESIHILFVGSGFKTHGLFRVIKSLKHYFKNSNVKLNIKIKVVGASVNMAENQKLVKNYKLNDYFIFEGFITKDELDELYNWADIGIGSMGLHRIGLKESSTLKAREYVARGLPFFWSTIDPDIPKEMPFILEFDSNDDIFHFDAVIDFAVKMKNTPNMHIQMRNHAEKYLTNNTKMNFLNKYLKSILCND
jgi:glycosyltransferase involved in cell wall biosynthesis